MKSKAVLVIVFSSLATLTTSGVMSPTARGGQVFETNISDLNTGTIGEYSTDGTTVMAPLVSGLTVASGIAVSGTNLFVVNAGSETIGKYTTSGATVNATLFATPGNEPYGIAVSGANVFITQPFGGRIGEYDANTGATVNPALVYGLSGNLGNLINSYGPYGIAAYGGNLFVTNLGTYINGVYSPGSGSIGEYNATTGAPVQANLITGLDTPYALSLSDGHIFVANFASGTSQTRGTGRIGEYNLDGTTVTTSLVSGLWAPIGIAVSGNDLFVTNAFDNNSIGKYNATTGATVNATFITGLNSPQAIVAVPEPSAFALGILATLSLAVSARRVLRGRQ